MKRFLPGAAGYLLMLLSFTAHSAENMKFHGTLVKAPDCHINNGRTIEVPFGNVGINRVDGIHYTKKIDYTINCDGKFDEALYLSVSGTAVNWDGAAVKASASNLAIKILQAGKPFTLGSKVRVVPGSLPVLSAVPVKKSGTTLAAGDFSAAATLVAFYQ